MMRLTDIYSLTEFQRNAKKHVARLKKSGRPQVLTVNGRAEIVVQDARSYQKILDLAEQAEAIAGIQRGLEDVSAGRTKPADRVLDEMRRRLKIVQKA